MTGLGNYSAFALLNQITGQQPTYATPNVWLALFTTVGTDAGSGFTEVTGSNYARVQVAGNLSPTANISSGGTVANISVPAWFTANGQTGIGLYVYDATVTANITSGTYVTGVGAANVTLNQATAGKVLTTDNLLFSAFQPAQGTGPASTTNAQATIIFPTPSGTGWGNITAFGLYDAATTGDLLAWDFLGNYSWTPATVSSASPGIITAPGIAGAGNGTYVIWSNEYGGTVPSFSQSNFTTPADSGLLVAGYQPGAPISFSVTNAGTAVNTSSTGNGMVRTVTIQPVAQNVVASFAVNTLTITAA